MSLIYKHVILIFIKYPFFHPNYAMVSAFYKCTLIKCSGLNVIYVVYMKARVWIKIQFSVFFLKIDTV